MLQNEEIGEEFVRYLLEIIFDRKFGNLKVVPQRVYYGQDTDTREQNAKSEELKAIHNLVKVVKQDPEVSESYMKWFEIERSLIAKGHIEGRTEGRAEELVRLCREFGQSEEDILARLMKDLNLSKDEALQYM